MTPPDPRHGLSETGSPFFDMPQEIRGQSILYYSHKTQPQPEQKRAIQSPSQIPQMLTPWAGVILRLGLTASQASSAAHRSIQNRTGFVQELLASGQVEEYRLYKAIAEDLGLRFLRTIPPERLLMNVGARMAALQSPQSSKLATIVDETGATVHVLADTNLDIEALRLHVGRSPEVRNRLRIAPPSVLREAIVSRSRERLLFQSQYDHFLRSPELSARFVLTGRQGLWIGAVLTLLALGLYAALSATVLALQTVAATAFLACILLRMAALGAARPIRLGRLPEIDPAKLPVYSVIVPLYRERELVSQLLVALGRLQWPRSKLEIKLVCEADDEETLAALRVHQLHSFIEIVTVPPGLPRTKPKALAYALPLCSGELVTLYDAEDRPHASQLIAAWQRFSCEADDVACLQAPLIVTNVSVNALSRMFAFEYSGLFRGLLPYLARGGLLLPLGGTSNHFRRSALVKVGGWDPFNVTEDADLGLRFARAGYRIGVLQHPTYEDGPEALRVWMPQRVRWFKGWMQTWLVHMRDPVLLWRQLGPLSFIAMQILFAGMILSALIHPIFLATVLFAIFQIVQNGAATDAELINAGIGLLAIAVGYGVFITLGWKPMARLEKSSLLKVMLLTPVHWMLLSVAAWRAIAEIYLRPHHWNKTPHQRTRKRPDQASATEGPPMIFSSSSPITPLSRPS